MSATEVVGQAAPTTTGPSVTHIARNREERPLVGLCGVVAKSVSIGSYEGHLDASPLPCVVCMDLHYGRPS